MNCAPDASSPPSPSPSLAALHGAIAAMRALCDASPSESAWFAGGELILRQLLNAPAWLPVSHSASHPQYYQQHALHIDPARRFSISSFVWGPGQGTPVHNHTIAGLVGVLQGAEICQRYSDDGLHPIGEPQRLNTGDVSAVTPNDAQIGDVHTVRNGLADRNSVSIHIYRGDISGTPRSVYQDGIVKPFASSYSAAAPLA